MFIDIYFDNLKVFGKILGVNSELLRSMIMVIFNTLWQTIFLLLVTLFQWLSEEEAPRLGFYNFGWNMLDT